MTPRLPTNRLNRHLLFWAGVTVLAGLSYILPDISNSCCFCHWVPIVIDLFFSMLPTFVVCTYLWAYLVLPLLFRRQFAGFLAGVLLLNLAEWFLNDLLTYSLKFPLKHWLHQEMPFEQDTWLFGSLFPGRTFWIRNLIAGLFIGVKLFRQWQQKQAESQRLEREKLQTEIQLLKTQLNPDLLFSSLDKLATLIRQKSKQSSELVLKLAHLLRYVLYESQAELVPLSREIDVIDHYIFLQRIIHPTNLEVSLTIRGATEYHLVAPSSLFPIVENAFHQLPVEQPDEPAWVSIDLAINETHLTLKVINGQSVTQTDNSNQLADIQKQLYFHYADEYDLQILSETDAFIVILTLPFATSSESAPVRTALLTRP